MALGILFLLYVALFSLALVCLILLVVARRARLRRIIVWMSASFSIVIAFLSASALPTNQVVFQIIAWSFGVMAAIGIVCYYKHQETLATLLIYASIIFGMIQLTFV